MFPSRNRLFSLILCSGVYLMLLVALSSAAPQAQAGALNPGSRLKLDSNPAIPESQTDINGPAGSGD